MKAILTKKGQRILVDDDDYEWLSKITWHVSAWGYAQTNAKDPADGKKRTVFMHRMILGLKRGDPEHVDHINGDRLDNRKSVNIRKCSPSQNMHNVRQRSNNSSGLKGVSFSKGMKRWTATVNVNGKRAHLSYHDTREEAHNKYCEVASRLHGSFFNPGVRAIEQSVSQS
jgi:hypothetical protein